MAFLDINELAAGKVFKGNILLSELISVEKYVKMVDGKILRSSSYGGHYDAIPYEAYEYYMTCDNWTEVKEETKHVPVLTELAKKLLDIEDTRIGIYFSNKEDAKTILEAVENSTDLIWISDKKPTEVCLYETGVSVLYLHGWRNLITWETEEKYTSESSFSTKSIYLDYDLMQTELVKIIEVKEVK